MDRILFGDNQFFAVNHLSDEKSRAQAKKFKDTKSIMDVLDYVYEIGIRTFMCTTHEQIEDICNCIRENPEKYHGFKIYPCMPYAHKYNNAVAELGFIEALKKIMPGNVIASTARGGIALARHDYDGIMKLLVDAEMKMFQGINTEVIFLQNIVTDLILGLGITDFFVAYSNYIETKYNAKAGFITMNTPALIEEFNKLGLKNQIICTSINKIGFRMPGGIENYKKYIADDQHKIIAMQTLAAGAIPPAEAMEYVCKLNGVESILFGASTKPHIKQTKDLIDFYSK